MDTNHSILLLKNHIKDIGRKKRQSQNEIVLLALWENEFVSSIHFWNLQIMRYGARISDLRYLLDELGLKLHSQQYVDKRGKQFCVYWLPCKHPEPKLAKNFTKVGKINV
jgi:hypothetical protein